VRPGNAATGHEPIDIAVTIGRGMRGRRSSICQKVMLPTGTSIHSARGAKRSTPALFPVVVATGSGAAADCRARTRARLQGAYPHMTGKEPSCRG
jgi:hypothetical protein